MIRLKIVICFVWAGTVMPAPPESPGAAALRDASVSQSFRWGDIDQNMPLLLGNGDIGGLFEPLGSPAWPFRTASFKLRANDQVIDAQVIDAQVDQGKVKVLSESRDASYP